MLRRSADLTLRRYITDPSQFPQMLEDKFAPQLVWIGTFRGGDVGFFESSIAAADARLEVTSALYSPCSCSLSLAVTNDENAAASAKQAVANRNVVPMVYAELAVSSALRNAASYPLSAPALYQPCSYFRRSLVFFSEVFLNPASAAQGMIVDHELDRMTSGVGVEEDKSLLGGFLKILGFDQSTKKNSSGDDKPVKHADDGKPSEGGGISGFLSGIANSVTEAVATAASAIAPAAGDDDLKYLEDQEPDRHLEEEDDARNKCCYCIPTPPTDQIKYITCSHKFSEYVKGEDDDPEFYSDKNDRCEPSAKAHRDFWRCLQRINQTEPLPFGAPEAEVTKRTENQLKWMSSALGFSRYINRRKELMNRKRCSLKKGMREGTAKLLLQPPEPDMDLAMLFVTLVTCPAARPSRVTDTRYCCAQIGLASYVYLLYTQISVLYSDWTKGDYTLLVAFLVKEVFFATYVVIWVVLRIALPLVALPIILLVKLATSKLSDYQKQKVAERRLLLQLSNLCVIHSAAASDFFNRNCASLQRPS